MGAFGTLFDVGHAAGPILAGLLIGFWGGQNFRASFGLIATRLLITALAFQLGVKSQAPPVTAHQL